jgi:nucleotide-binding universal stress UspA family protein
MKALDAKTRVELKNILFSTDFSPAAAAALPYAGILAKRFGANLFALHVRAPVINPMTPPAGWPALEKAAELEEIERRKSLRNAIPGIGPTVLIKEGGIWENLQAAIRKFNIDLLVIGTHGRAGFGKLLLGSAAEEIFRDAPCPVLTVGPHVPSELNREGEFTRILYAASFAAESAAAAPYAVSLAQEYQAKLTLLHVLEDPKAGEFVVPQDLMASSKLRLVNLVPPEAELWCEPDYIVERGQVAEKILDVAKNRHADLIVLGVHRPVGVPGAATHLPIATAHYVVANAHCPVLTVRD